MLRCLNKTPGKWLGLTKKTPPAKPCAKDEATLTHGDLGRKLDEIMEMLRTGRDQRGDR